jgi:hypothetical protein
MLKSSQDPRQVGVVTSALETLRNQMSHTDPSLRTDLLVDQPRLLNLLRAGLPGSLNQRYFRAFAKPVETGVTIGDAGFSVKQVLVPLGGQVRFGFAGRSAHDVVDALSVGYGRSRPRSTPALFTETLPSAGTFSFRDARRGSAAPLRVSVPMQAHTASAGQPKILALTWSLLPERSGYTYDVEVRLPNAANFVAFRTATSLGAATFTAQAAGSYSFIARLRFKSGQLAVSGWYPAGHLL